MISRLDTALMVKLTEPGPCLNNSLDVWREPLDFRLDNGLHGQHDRAEPAPRRLPVSWDDTAAPSHMPATPQPTENASAACNGRPMPHDTTAMMPAPSLCRPAPRRTPDNTVLTPSPADQRHQRRARRQGFRAATGHSRLRPAAVTSARAPLRNQWRVDCSPTSAMLSQTMTGSRRATMAGSIVNSIDHVWRKEMSSAAKNMFSPPPRPVTTCRLRAALALAAQSTRVV